MLNSQWPDAKACRPLAGDSQPAAGFSLVFTDGVLTNTCTPSGAGVVVVASVRAGVLSGMATFRFLTKPSVLTEIAGFRFSYKRCVCQIPATLPFSDKLRTLGREFSRVSKYHRTRLALVRRNPTHPVSAIRAGKRFAGRKPAAAAIPQNSAISLLQYITTCIQ